MLIQFLALFCATVFLVVPAMVSAAEPDAELHAFFATAMEDRLALNPMEAEELGDFSRNDQWPDISEAGMDKRLALYARQLRALRQFDYDELNQADQLSYRLFELTNQRVIETDQWRNYGYVVHQMYGWHTAIPSHLLNVHRIQDVNDAEAYIARLQKVQKLMAQAVSAMRLRESVGVMPPQFVYPRVIESSKNLLTGAPFDDGDNSVLLADFMTKVGELNLDAEVEQELMERARTALLEGVKPGYEHLIAELKRQQAIATTEAGVWKFPNGGKFYANRLNRITTTDLSAQEIHRIGLDNVARIHDQMREIIATVGFEGTLQEFFEFLKTDDQFYFPDSVTSREEYLQLAQTITDAMTERVPEFFDLTPKAPMEVRRVEPYREESSGKAFYERASLDGTRPGIFYANLRNMQRMPKYQLEALSYHEGIPGHHFQISIAQELEGVPLFQRTSSFTSFIEGWGLYTEELGKDMGFYTDPYSDFGRLDMELWRACRLVVDTGIHHQRWTREQAIEYLLANTPASEAAATSAIERYIVMPGQATAYMIGKLKIMELRQRAMDQLEDQFDWRGFHRVVLGSGAVPLSILEANVDAWLAGFEG